MFPKRLVTLVIALGVEACSSSDPTRAGGDGGGLDGAVAGPCVPADQQISCLRTVPESIAPAISCTPKKAGSPGYDGCTPNTPCGTLNGCPLERCDPVDGVVEAIHTTGSPSFVPPATLLPPMGTEMLGRGTGWFARGDGTPDLGSCGYPAVRNLTGVALSTKNFGHADWCGACAEVVSESGRRVRVQIVDQCTGCKALSLDIPGGADTPFGLLTDPNFATGYQCAGYDGSLPISWHIVPCEVEGGILVAYLEGFSAWSPAIRLLNHRLNVVMLEEQFGGQWTTLARQDDNKYFLAARTGAAPVPVVLRVTAIDGATVTATLPAFEPGKLYEAKGQF